MKFLVPANSDLEHTESDINCFYIDIDKELAKKILARRKKFLEMKEEDPPLASLRYNEMFGGWLEDADICDELNASDSELLREPFLLRFLDLDGKEREWVFDKEAAKITEWSCMVITEAGVTWTCREKQSDEIIWSRDFPYNLIEECL